VEVFEEKEKTYSKAFKSGGVIKTKKLISQIAKWAFLMSASKRAVTRSAIKGLICQQ
jgi:hypothetical protein